MVTIVQNLLNASNSINQAEAVKVCCDYFSIMVMDSQYEKIKFSDSTQTVQKV